MSLIFLRNIIWKTLTRLDCCVIDILTDLARCCQISAWPWLVIVVRSDLQTGLLEPSDTANNQQQSAVTFTNNNVVVKYGPASQQHQCQPDWAWCKCCQPFRKFIKTSRNDEITVLLCCEGCGCVVGPDQLRPGVLCCPSSLPLTHIRWTSPLWQPPVDPGHNEMD